jgi:hypothetical protein
MRVVSIHRTSMLALPPFTGLVVHNSISSGWPVMISEVISLMFSMMPFAVAPESRGLG